MIMLIKLEQPKKALFSIETPEGTTFIGCPLISKLLNDLHSSKKVSFSEKKHE